MKELINAIIVYLNAATGTLLSGAAIIKGFDEAEPDQVAIESYPYVAIDDGGERVDPETAGRTQTRVYVVDFFIAVIVGDYEDSLDALLDLTEEVKVELEKEVNRQKEGHVWGINITPVAGEIGDTNTLFRARQVSVEFFELEDNYGEW